MIDTLTFSDPTRNLSTIGVNEGMNVADLGAGSGFYSMQAARMVGAEGRVYAVDVQRDLLERIKESAKREHLVNLDVLWGDIEKIGGSRLGEEKVDLVLICNTLFQVEHKEDLVTEAYRILKSGGRVAIIDWTDSHGGVGPESGLVFSPTEAKELFSKKFTLDKEFDAGDHHYGLILRKER